MRTVFGAQMRARGGAGVHVADRGAGRALAVGIKAATSPVALPVPRPYRRPAMRMSHYYLGLAFLLPIALAATAVTGLWHDGSHTHVAVGLFTAIFCVAINTLLILFMIVTGRVLKEAMKSRPLGPEFLAELNEFFANKKAYPLALLAATIAVAAAVLGYGRNIGVPITVHMLLGLAAVLVNVWALPIAWRTLRSNQALVDRVAAELDLVDAERGTPPEATEGEPEWTMERPARWMVFAFSAWLPYLYWALVEWRGDFGQVAPSFLAISAVLSGVGLWNAWRASTS